VNKKEELIKLIQENPTLPLLFMVRNDEILDEYGSTVHENFWCEIQTVYYWGEEMQTVTDDYIEIQERVQAMLSDEEEYENLTDEEFEKCVDKYIEENIRHYKAIVIHTEP
jgi:hypothetical protein